jgi:quercetin dioxygenase-like cupin family protein
VHESYELTQRGIWRSRQRDDWFKVTAADSVNGLFMTEQTNTKQGGGPPKHLHVEQDEWFYAIDGPYVVEVGDRLQLNAGDSVLAPRGIPHAFAFAGEGVGRLLVGFTPAGRMEEFFRELQTRKDFFGTGTPEDRVRLRAYGMEFVGPPLSP